MAARFVAPHMHRVVAIVALLAGGCTIHHSRQALWADAMDTPSADATFVTEEDSGLTLLGLFPVADADHYAVLLERMKRRHGCTRIHHAQLDYFTDFWLIVGFPIARVTAVCEHGPAEGPDSGGAPPVEEAPPEPQAPAPDPEQAPEAPPEPHAPEPEPEQAPEPEPEQAPESEPEQAPSDPTDAPAEGASDAG